MIIQKPVGSPVSLPLHLLSLLQPVITGLCLPVSLWLIQAWGFKQEFWQLFHNQWQFLCVFERCWHLNVQLKQQNTKNAIMIFFKCLVRILAWITVGQNWVNLAIEVDVLIVKKIKLS